MIRLPVVGTSMVIFGVWPRRFTNHGFQTLHNPRTKNLRHPTSSQEHMELISCLVKKKHIVMAW
jgi:hypothetical protein